MRVTFKLETFEGPLDLLLHLIDKNEMDIYDIPIRLITDQYMEYLSMMQAMELDITSEFLVMAATLLSIKSQMLLPKPPVMDNMWEEEYYDEDYDPRAELVQKLIEYKKYKEIAEHLRDKELERSLIYTREPADLTPFAPKRQENPVEGLSTADLMWAFRKALRKMTSRHRVTKIHRDEISVKDRIKQVLRLLDREGGKLLFSSLLEDDYSRGDLVVSFLALLELMKMKRIVCFQHRLFDDIVIQSREDDYEVAIEEAQISY
ncbi:segregation and condensation protein A [Gorillibacterium massiliense]|uniref:segregation and condensation protein A n=1 Tax=Gorillibacterium massiliense TaxID=1280390 RepID=UPI0004AD3489|nr:segregation/condensation protein A [Gorillibacterium massiliense]